MKVTIYEVNFGEAVLYQEGDSKLLVDCGAKFGQKGNLAFNRVKSKIDSKTKLLISHFDEDHYNGIIQMPDTMKFSKIYLPLYIYKDKEVQNTEEVFSDTIRTWTYLMAIGKKKKINALHSLFLKIPKLVKTIDDICCVGAGFSFSMERKKVDVLWPRPNTVIRKRMYAEEVLQILRNNCTNIQQFEEFVFLADVYTELFLKVYRFYSSIKEEDISQDISRETFYEEMERFRNAFERVSRLSLNIDLEESAKKRIDSISSINIRNMNESSVVLESGNEIIAFGDVSARIIKYMKNNKIISYKEYKAVKVQHHGTEAYWSDDLPNAKVYFISNSGVAKPNWSIDKRYGLMYADKVTCTNDNPKRCGYYNCTRKCSMCNVGLVTTEIIKDCATI